MRLRDVILAAALAAAAPAQAFCVVNQLRDRDIRVEQQGKVEKLREDRMFNATLKPGQEKCCRNLDCNPGGRDESLVPLMVTILGKPEHYCGARDAGEILNVTGDGTLRVQHNPRHPRSSVPYIVRIRTPKKDLTGPAGVPCPEAPTETPKKGKP